MLELEKYKKELTSFIKGKIPTAEPLLLCVRGSHMYGTSTENSDVDFGGVYIQSEKDILGNNYIEQINDDTNDTVLYEVRRFIELLSANNPNIMELLSIPEDCLIYKHPVIDYAIGNPEVFISKICAQSFTGYANAQVKKASGQDKKQNWEAQRVTRKTPLDFCYVIRESKAIPLSKIIERDNLDISKFGLSHVPNSMNIYAVYYDYDNVGFRGLQGENSNQLRLSSIPKDKLDSFLFNISYNMNGYTKHCKDYSSYQTWLEKRNLNRWVEVKNHGQKIDGKNMMHCIRLLEMSQDIVRECRVKTRRDNVDYLLSIRKGEIKLDDLIEYSRKMTNEIKVEFAESDLPESVNLDYTKDILYHIRSEFYGN